MLWLPVCLQARRVYNLARLLAKLLLKHCVSIGILKVIASTAVLVCSSHVNSTRRSCAVIVAPLTHTNASFAGMWSQPCCHSRTVRPMPRLLCARSQVMEFTALSKNALLFLKGCFSEVLSCTDVENVRGIFSRWAPLSLKAMLRSGATFSLRRSCTETV